MPIIFSGLMFILLIMGRAVILTELALVEISPKTNAFNS